MARLTQTLVALMSVFGASFELKGELQEVSRVGADAICDTVQQYSGYYKLTTGDKHYFYWFFESRSKPSTDPVVLWMTGGPGCSSEVALFGENGPCQVNENGTDTVSNPYSWNTNANVIYIDQPAGTGYSYGSGKDHNEAGVAADMYDFLQQFMVGHPQYQPLDFYAVGESYAGHYVPAVTHYVWQQNKILDGLGATGGQVRINLKGTSVGNGLTDPSIQYNYYKDMVVSTNDHKAAVGEAVHKEMVAATKPCVDEIIKCNSNKTLSSAACVTATETCNAGLLLPYQATGMNPYDMRIKCAKKPLCYDFSNVGTYLERPEVMAAIGVTKDHKWADCNHVVAAEFELTGDWMHDYQTMIPDQLADGIRVLIYAGDQDFICNWLGNQAWVNALDWAHGAEFKAAPVGNWSAAAGGAAAGTLQSANGLSFLRVFDAGHMVPRDQPEVALGMLQQFIAGGL